MHRPTAGNCTDSCQLLYFSHRSYLLVANCHVPFVPSEDSCNRQGHLPYGVLSEKSAEPLELSCGMLGACTAYPSDVKDHHSSIQRGTPLQDRPLQTPHDCRFTLLPGSEIRRCYMRRHLERILICMNDEPINVTRAQGETYVRGLPLDTMLRRARRRIMTDSEDKFYRRARLTRSQVSPHATSILPLTAKIPKGERSDTVTSCTLTQMFVLSETSTSIIKGIH